MSSADATTAVDYRQAPDNRQLSHLPGKYGLPFLGQSLRMLGNLPGFLQAQHQRYGNLSRVGIGRQHVVLALGPELSQQVLLDRDQNFSNQMGYERNMGPFFGGGLMLRDFQEHRMHRRITQTAFKFDTLKQYMPLMNEMLAEGISDWPQQPELYFHHQIKELLLRVAARIFLGVKEDMGDELRQLNQAFLDSVEGLSALVPIEFPGLKFHRGRHGRRYLYGYFSARVPARRMSEGNDMFTLFAHERDENGELFSDDDVVRHIIFLMMAAHDTTTSALSSCMAELVQHPEWQTRLRDECRDVLDGPITYEDQPRLVLMDRFMHETLRMHSPVPALMRRTVRDCELGGKPIPAHSMLTVAPSFSHRMAECWDEPETFDPERFAPGREEQKRHPFNYIPFGGGAHKCIGMHFAMMQIKCFLSNFLCHYEAELPADHPQPLVFQELPFPFPKGHLPLVIKPLS